MTSDNLVSVTGKHRAYRCWRSSVCDMCNLFLWGWETECSFHLLTSFTDVSYKVFILFMVFFNGKWEKSEVPHTANAHFDVWEPEKVPKHWRDPTTVISKPLFPPISAFNREEQRNDSVSFLLLCLDFADFPGVICSFSKLFKVWDFTGSCWKCNAALEYSEMQISSSVTATEMQTYTLVFETEFLTCNNWRILKIIIDLFQLILFVFSCLFSL